MSKEKNSSHVEILGGAPVPTPNGQPLESLAFSVDGDQAFDKPVIRALVNADFRVFTQRTNLMLDDGGKSVEQAADQVDAVHKIAPDAALFVSTEIAPSFEWNCKNPHEFFLSDSGETCCTRLSDSKFTIRKIDTPSFEEAGEPVEMRDIYEKRVVSPFSRRFPEDAARVLSDLLDELDRRRCGKAVVGVFLAAHSTGEWNIFLPGGDFSRCGLTYFREYLKQKYGDVTSLHRAWGRENVTFETVLPPMETGIFHVGFLRWDDVRSRDYLDAYGKALAEQFVFLADSVRQRNPNLLVGGFWGGLEWHHAGIEQVIEATDFLATPVSYENRHPGGSVCSQNPVPDSLSLRTRFLWDELDTRTHLSDDCEARYGRPRNEDEAMELVWRDAAQSIVQGRYAWWYDFGNNAKKREYMGGPEWIHGSWYTTPRLLAALKRINEVYRNLGELDRTPVHDVRIFSPFDAPARCARNMYQQAQRATEWCRLGTPVGSYALDDLLAGRIGLAKANVFVLCQSLTDHEIARLQQLLKDSGVMAVWVNGAGLLSPDGHHAPDSGRAHELTGIRQRLIRCGMQVFDPGLYPRAGFKMQVFHAVLDPQAHAAVAGLEPGDRLGHADRPLYSSLDQSTPVLDINHPWTCPPDPLDLAIEITDDDATIFARFSHTGTPAAAIKEVNGFMSVAYNMHYLPSRLLRELVRVKGAHIYAENDNSVWASRGLIALHTARDDYHTLRLTQTCTLRDLRTGAIAFKNVKEVTLAAPMGKTFFYQLTKST